MSKQFLTGNQAFAHAALEAGVGVCAGYPGTPSSEVIETIAQCHAAGTAQGVHVEWSTNEKAALELLAGASYAGARTLFTCKQVGMNVASDPLMSLNYVGVNGGCVLYVTDDPGPISSQTEQDTRRFAAFAKVPVFDPTTPEQGCDMMKAAFDLSERYGTPVFVRPTTRVCHASTYFEVAEATQAREPQGFEKDSKWVIFPKRAYAAHAEINERLPKIQADFEGEEFARFNPIEEIPSSFKEPARNRNTCDPFEEESDCHLGIVAGGISYAYVREALRRFPLLPAVRVMQVGTPYPFPAALVREFAEGLSDIIVFEELDHVLEDELLKLAGREYTMPYLVPYRVHGKLTGETTNRGENTVDAIAEQLYKFFKLEDMAFGQFAVAMERRDAACKAEAAEKAALSGQAATPEQNPVDQIQPPARPPLLCPGCPHRGSFYAVKRALRRVSDGIFCGDIGCYTLGNAKPLDAVDTCLCMGAGITIAQGFSVAEPGKKAIAFVGDSTFFASGMTGIANAVYNQHDITVAVLDNSTTAMTGSQPHPGTGVTLMGPKTKPISIEAVLRALGVEVITHANPLRLDEAVAAAREAIEFEGPSAIIFKSPCVKLIKPQEPVRLDLDACTGCGKCVLSIGCPALSWSSEAKHPMVDDSLCNGCGLCVDLCKFGALVCASREAAEGSAENGAQKGGAR